MEYDLSVREEFLTIGKVDYILREASGEAGTKYRNADSACYEYGPNGNISKVTGLAETGPLLVSLCLFERVGNKPVPIEQIKAWPDRVQQDLFRRAKELSNFDQPVNLDAMIKQRDRLNERIASFEKDEAERKKLSAGA